MIDQGKIAVVVPCYKVKQHVLEVLKRMGPEVARIYCVDDACPEQSGAYIQEHCDDPRVTVVFLEQNQGVGGAVMAGYGTAIDDGMDVIVKVDGDGQMDPALIPCFAAPLLQGQADYTKGNRFYDLTHISRMPAMRIFGNAGLSFLSKLSTGYWDIFDPTNGYTAITARSASVLPFSKISRRYFFETDMLFRLGTFRAVVLDIPMDALYGDEESNLKIGKILHEFLFKHVRNFFKRIFYVYFLRDLSPASIELLGGGLLLAGGTVFTLAKWYAASQQKIAATSGTVMIGAVMIILGFQLLLAFLAYDAASVPRMTISDRLSALRSFKGK